MSIRNRVQLMGVVGDHPTESTDGIQARISFFLMVNQRTRNNKGQRIGETQDLRIAVFDHKLRDFAAKYLKKHSVCILEGYMISVKNIEVDDYCQIIATSIMIWK